MSIEVLISVILLGISLIYFLLPPKKINYLYGYRTSKSMKNQENWLLANRLGAKYFLISSIFNVITSIGLNFLLKIQFSEWFIALLIIEFIIIFYLTEKQLK